MKTKLVTKWPLLRWFRLALAVFLFANAYETHQWIFVPMGLFFLFQALFNWSCSGQANCTINNKKYNE